ncbi:hypothetical protein PHMEG_00015407 [Phytophthora megakarya]|uniref:Uncharacterized protein n=1 Tax=Phytophthora megakarya TaxID=4795 RepID=A0A225W3W8_9STRA|nr:hypothetical protein PHMEG_00015407 [Phytophthora megakarya]
MDNVRYMPPDYMKADPRSRNPRGGGGSGPKPSTPKAVIVLDLTGSGGSKTSSTKSRPSRTRSTSGTKRKAPQQSSSGHARSARKLELDITEVRQMRPKKHCPRGDLACGPDTDLDLAMEVDAQKLVPDGLLWEGLRQDVRMLMLTGLTYEDALKLLRSDESIHHLLPGYMVQLMLAQMIDWGTLDFTPWSKYVPESNYLDAEKLQKLKDVAAEVELINGVLSESSDDETQDPSFSLKPDAEEADNALEAQDETEDLDDGEDEVSTNTNGVGPKTRGQASSGTRRPSPTSAKNPNAMTRTPNTKIIKRAKTNTGRAKETRHPTDLALRDFQTLSEDELMIIEVCDRDVTSTFRVFGINMKFSDKIPTLGFPDNEPHKHETKYLKVRWSIEA